jgi:hypothetical protein
LKKLQQQDKTSLDYWKGWYCFKIDLTRVSWLFGQILIQSRRLAVWNNRNTR